LNKVSFAKNFYYLALIYTYKTLTSVPSLERNEGKDTEGGLALKPGEAAQPILNCWFNEVFPHRSIYQSICLWLHVFSQSMVWICNPVDHTDFLLLTVNPIPSTFCHHKLVSKQNCKKNYLEIGFLKLALFV